MPSYLGHYAGFYGEAATDRVAKFERAVQSVIAQTFDGWELLIVADGCDDTWIRAQAFPDFRIRALRVPKQPLWSERVRNAGIHKADGRYIVYLDTDDVFTPDHLEVVHRALEVAEFPTWAVVDDQVWDLKREEWVQRLAYPERRNGCGTSNFVHVAGQAIYWPRIVYRYPSNGYDHDAQFLKHLRETGRGIRLGPAGYRVMHIPKQYEL